MGGSERTKGPQLRNYVGDSMDLLRKAAQQAMVALETKGEHHPRVYESIAALRAALAQPEQEPVAWLRQRDNTLAVNDGGLFGSDWTPLYAHPPQRKPLTDDEIELAYRKIWRDLQNGFSADWIEAGIRYAEKVHGIE